MVKSIDPNEAIRAAAEAVGEYLQAPPSMWDTIERLIAKHTRAAVAGPRGDVVSRKEVVARIEQQIRLWNNDTVTMACADMLAEIKQMVTIHAATASPTPAESRTCVKCRHSNFNRVQGECDEPDSENIFCGCKCEFAPAERTRVEGEQRLLTPEELADIERFQQQRRKNPVATDAWLYIAEIDRLLTHIRLNREQLENEIFQDATDPAFTSDSARRAAQEIADWMNWRKNIPQIAHEQNIVSLTNMLSKYFVAAAPADNDAMEVCRLLTTLDWIVGYELAGENQTILDRAQELALKVMGMSDPPSASKGDR